MKKTLSFLLALLVVLGCLAPALAETPEIRWLTTGDAAAKPMEPTDRIIEALNQKFDIRLNVQYVPEGNVEKVNVEMASGNFPAIVTGSFGSSATQSWIKNGMLLPLNDYFADNPHLKAWCDTYSWSAIDGKFYGLPFITQYTSSNMLIMMRGDWLKNLNLEYPKNLDEMMAAMDAFTNKDPDGNGQNDTYGFTAVKPIGNFNWVQYAFGRQYGDYELDDNGNVIPFFEHKSFVPAMTYIKEMWDKGYIDKEFMLNDQSKMEEKFYQGKAGAIPVALYRHVSRHENNLKKITPDGFIAYALPPVGPDGTSFGLAQQGRAGFLTGITVSCADPAKAAKFLDFMVSPEGNDLVRLGIEGVHYTKNGDAITFNEDERAKDAFAGNGWAHALAWGSLYWPLESGYLPAGEANRDRALDSVALATKAQKPSLIKQKTPLEIENGAMLNDIYNQYFIDMLQGKLSVEDGAKKLSADWRSQGGDELLEELNAAYKATK